MSRILLYGTLFLFLIIVETSFLSSLPPPFQAIPLVPIVGIWLFHQIPSRIGVWYLLGWGIWYDAFGLSLFASRIVIALVMIVILAYASGRVFSQHSIYGLFGLSVSVWIGWLLAEALFRFLSPSGLEIAFYGFLSRQSMILIEILIGTGLLFILSLRVRERLRLT